MQTIINNKYKKALSRFFYRIIKGKIDCMKSLLLMHFIQRNAELVIIGGHPVRK